MRGVVVAMMLAGASGVDMAVAGPAAGPAADPDPAAAHLDELAKAAKCSDAASPYRPWCIATKWATGTAAPLPTGKVLVGITIELEDGKDAGNALVNKVSLTAFASDASGVKVTTVKPTNAGEEQSTAAAIFAISAQLKGKAKVAALPADLAGYVKTLTGAYKPAKSAAEWTWSGASNGRARKVGAYWVVIETPSGANGIWATILTDAWQ